MKERLDILLVNRNLAGSREKAKALIMSGIVYVNGQKEDKAGASFPEDCSIEIRGTTLKYVSRGGLKLEKAVAEFGVRPEGKVCMDVGASTGGFTDCMLQNGAVKVYAVDVGRGQLDWKLRNDPRVVCMEKTNIRYVTPDQIGEPVQLASIDVSFISLSKVLPAVRELLTEDGEVAALIKPQFVAGLTFSPIRGPEGNIEYLYDLRCVPEEAQAVSAVMEEMIAGTVAAAHESLNKPQEGGAV